MDIGSVVVLQTGKPLILTHFFPVLFFYFYFNQIGKLTSCVDGLTSLGDSPFRGLGYIVKQAGAAGGMDVKVNDVSARIVDIPFAKRLLDTVTA